MNGQATRCACCWLGGIGGAGRMPGLWKSMVVVARAKGE